MSLTRTTLRLDDRLKKAAQAKALEENTTLQVVLNQALEDYLQHAAKQKAHAIVFQTHDLGQPLDELKRRDFYPTP